MFSDKMRKVLGVCACLLIVALDITAWFLAMKAKNAQNQAKHSRACVFDCKGLSHYAFILGVAAAVLLGLAHLLANFLGFLGVTSQNMSNESPPSKMFSMLIFLATWIICSVGVTLLVFGTRSNQISKMSCGFKYHKFRPTGAVLCIVHAALSLAYFVTSAVALYTTA